MTKIDKVRHGDRQHRNLDRLPEIVPRDRHQARHRPSRGLGGLPGLLCLS
ncbi:hypothetical protein GGC47_005408 [Bosea sp. OAE752]